MLVDGAPYQQSLYNVTATRYQHGQLAKHLPSAASIYTYPAEASPPSSPRPSILF